LWKNGLRHWHLGKCCDYGIDRPHHDLLPENVPKLRKLEIKHLQTESLKKSRMKVKIDKLKKEGHKEKSSIESVLPFSSWVSSIFTLSTWLSMGANPQQHMHTSGVNVSTTDSSGSVIQRLTQENAPLKDKISKLKSMLSKTKWETSAELLVEHGSKLFGVYWGVVPTIVVNNKDYHYVTNLHTLDTITSLLRVDTENQNVTGHELIPHKICASTYFNWFISMTKMMF